jgi:hypothetical protein
MSEWGFVASYAQQDKRHSYNIFVPLYNENWKIDREKLACISMKEDIISF